LVIIFHLITLNAKKIVAAILDSMLLRLRSDSPNE